MFVAEIDNISTNSGTQIIGNKSYFPLLQKNKQCNVSQSKTAKKLSIPSSSKKSVSMESEKTEEQGKICIDKLANDYIQNGINITQKYYFLQMNI